MMTTNITLLNTSTSQCTEKSQEVLTFYQKATSIDPKKMKKKNIGQFLILADFSILALFFKFQLNKILLKI